MDCVVILADCTVGEQLGAGREEVHIFVDAAVPSFDPTRPPAGRLARLGVVFDGRTPPGGARPLATMCARAGIDAVWLAGALDGTPLDDGMDAWAEAGELASALRGTVIGVFVEGSGRLAADVAAFLGARGTSEDSAAGRDVPFEIAVFSTGPDETTLRSIRDALVVAGVRARLSMVVRSPEDLGPLLGVADDIVLSAWHSADLESAADESRAAAVNAGRDPASLGVAALIPVSVGRTVAEASARAEMDPAFARYGHPADIGIFGTLEECQDRVIALAHAGITDLRCVLPATPDVHDVIAQLTAITLGTTNVLVSGSLRSPSPPPPQGWGGRPHRPPSPQVSSGSRRRG
jgi:hypothetical protein